jgi:NitT/TauT family transport system substrate-binding protein
LLESRRNIEARQMRSEMGRKLVRLMHLATLVLAAVALSSSARAADKVKVTYASFDALYAPYFLGIDKGYFAEGGLDVELVQAGGGTATPALMSGQVQFSSSSGSAVSAIIKGAPLRVVMTLAVSLPWKLWATAPEITSLKDLKGKPVGIETRGGLDELATRAALLKAGLPQDWVIYSPIGIGGVQRVAVMQSGSMPAIFLSYLEERTARASGALQKGHVLVDFQHDIQIPYNGLATSTDLIAKNPDLVQRFTEAVLKGARYLKANRAGTLKVLQKYAKNVPLEHISESMDETQPTVLAKGEAALDLRQLDLGLRSTMLGVADAARPPLDKVYDYSFVEKAVADLDARHWQPGE